MKTNRIMYLAGILGLVTLCDSLFLCHETIETLKTGICSIICFQVFFHYWNLKEDEENGNKDKNQ